MRTTYFRPKILSNFEKNKKCPQNSPNFQNKFMYRQANELLTENVNVSQRRIQRTALSLVEGLYGFV